MHVQLKRRQAVLLEACRQCQADLDATVRCSDIAAATGLAPHAVIVTARQLAAKGWIGLTLHTDASANADPTIEMKMAGIEEAERMERTALQKFYEDHVVLWSLILLILGFTLSTLSGVVVNATKPAPTIINVIMPEPKAK